MIALFMAFSVLFLSAFIACEAGHDCEGEDCPVCQCIMQCENILRNIDGGVTLHSIVPLCFCFVSAVCVGICPVVFTTPVSMKVRLND